MKKYMIAAISFCLILFAALIFHNKELPPKTDLSISENTGQENGLDNILPSDAGEEQQTGMTEPEKTKDYDVSTNSEDEALPSVGDEKPAAGTESKPQTNKVPTTKENKIEGPTSPVTIPVQNHDLFLLEQIIRTAGFRYDSEQNIFYSDTDPWQKNFGFTSVYDAFAKFGNMIYETKRFKFSYGGHDWMFQVWKGRYGITSGAEIGIYYKDPSVKGDFYECADYDKYIAMDFKLYKGDKLYLYREPTRHWWLTGFRLGDITYGNEFLMEFTFYLDNKNMADALENAVISEGFIKGDTYIRDGNNIRVFW